MVSCESDFGVPLLDGIPIVKTRDVTVVGVLLLAEGTLLGRTLALALRLTHFQLTGEELESLGIYSLYLLLGRTLLALLSGLTLLRTLLRR